MYWDRFKQPFAMDLRTMGLVRVCLALVILADLIIRFGSIDAFYGEDGVLPRAAALTHTGSWRFSLHLLNGHIEYQYLLFAFTGLCTLALLVGYKTRSATVLCWILMVSLDNRNRIFMQENLGCMLREQIRFENGAIEIGSWMSTTSVHHEIAYVRDNKGLNGRLHHFALWVDNREDVLRAADIFRENGIFIEVGPSKHNNSQAFYLYSYEPGGNRVEVYTSGFQIFAPDFEPVIWTEDNRDGGVFWSQKLPESFSTYATPVADDDAVAEPQSAPVIDPQ